jgi:hypothetical protein
MTEKDYLLLLKKQVQSKRVICGFNTDAYGKAVVTTGIPKQYNEGQTIYEGKKTVSYEDYNISQLYQNTKKQR